MFFKKKKKAKSKVLWLFLLLIPVIAIIIASTNADDEKQPEAIIWSDVELSAYIPEPELNSGYINSNSTERLDIDLIETTQTDFKTYKDKCIELGYIIDKSESTNNYTAYNKDGYFLELYFRETESELCINLDCPKVYGELLWSNSEMAQLLPKPESSKGDILEDSKEKLYAKIADISLAEFNSYVKLCSDNGFNVEVNSTEKSYSAKNETGFKLTVDYIGFNTISITMLEPIYHIDIEAECVKNLMFSTYDVKVYFDDSYEKIITHGNSETLSYDLARGTYTLKFESADDADLTGTVSIKVTKDELFKFKLSCTSLGINIDTLAGSVTNESATTTENETTEEQTTDNISVLSDYELAFERANKLYSLYFMFDTDTNKVVYFSSDDSYVDKGSYSGDFESGITITWAHGEYTDKFIYSNSSATYIDANGDDWEYEFCSIDKAQNRLNVLRPEEAPTPAENMETTETDNWDGIKLTVNDISMSGQCEFNHTDGEIMRLGNNEHGTITLTIDNPNATEDDIIILYDEAIIDLKTESPVHTNSSTIITAKITGKTEGICDIEIYTKYDIATQGEEAYCLVLPVKKYNNTDGRIVYITPSGEKYHFSKSCAGDNAYGTTFSEAKSYDYSSCANCS